MTLVCVSLKCLCRTDILSKPTDRLIYYYYYCSAHGPPCGQCQSIL